MERPDFPSPMNHHLTVRTWNRKVAQLRQARFGPIAQWFEMMDLGVITPDLPVNLKEIEPTRLAGEPPAAVWRCPEIT
jgi:hypothetical protein